MISILDAIPEAAGPLIREHAAKDEPFNWQANVVAVQWHERAPVGLVAGRRTTLGELPVVWIEHLVVDPEHRGHRMAAVLMAALMQWAPAQGVGAFVGHIPPDLPRTHIAEYAQRFGFVQSPDPALASWWVLPVQGG